MPQAPQDEGDFSSRLRAMLEVTQELATARSFDDFCRCAVELGRQRLGFDRMGLWLVSDDGENIRGSFGTDEQGRTRDERGEIHKTSSGDWSVLLRREQPYYVRRDAKLVDDKIHPVGRGSRAAAALWDGQKAVGLLAVDNLLTGRTLASSDGEVLALYASMLGHLSLLHRARQSHRESEDRLEYIIDNTWDIIFHIDLAGNYTFANKAAEGLTGYPLSELIGMNMARLVAPEDREEVFDRLRRRLAGLPLPQPFVFRIVHRSGKNLWVELTTKEVLQEGKLVAIQGIARNITDRKQAEWALQESQARYRAVVEDQTELICRSRPDGTVTFVNDAVCRFTGRSREQLLGSSYFAFLPPQALAEVREGLAKIAAGHPVETVEYPLQTADGRQFWFQWTNRVLMDGQGNVSELQSVGRDITDRKLAEQALREREEELRHAQRMETVGRLAGGVAHDFNNQLTVIKGYCDLLLQDFPPEHPARPPLLEIRTSAARAEKLTRQLLAFSRKQALSPERLELNAALRQMRGMLSGPLPHNVDLQILESSRPVCALVDRSQLQQALLNLVMNSSDAMPDGGRIDIRVAAAELAGRKMVPTGRVAAGGFAEITVADTGCGMGADVLDRVFDPFFTTKGDKGTGLGLSMVYGFMQQSGGFLDVQSELGKGTTMRLYLPLAEEQSEE